MTPVDRYLAELPGIPGSIVRPNHWPTPRSAQRARKVYRLMFLFAAALTAMFLATGRLSVLLVLCAAAAALALAGWFAASAYSEGYSDGADHAVEDAAALAERAMVPPNKIERDEWAFVMPAEKGQGYVYVVEFGTGSIKVGQSTSPIRRVGEHQRDAWAYNVVTTNAWISAPHRAYLSNEVKLMAAVSRLPDCTRAKREYFHGVDFERVVDIATELASRPTPVRLRRPSKVPRTQPAPAPATPAPGGPPAH